MRVHLSGFLRAIALAAATLAILTVVSVRGAFNGVTSAPTAITPAKLLEATASLGCQTASEAVGAADWDTVCNLSPDVSTCSERNMSYASGSYCRLHYLCSGWVGDTSAERYPQLTLGFTSSMTNISRIEISEKGHRGWVGSVKLLAAEGANATVFEVASDAWDTPSEAYKLSPKQRDGGAYFAPGLDYRGGTNTTLFGRACELWSSQSALPRTVDNGLAGSTNNYCRNPDNDQWGPWCFVNGASGLEKEYCLVPATEGCDDKPLVFVIDPPLEKTYTGIEITMKHSEGAMPAIDAVTATGSVALSCHQDAELGYWKAPDCNTCVSPYKGTSCNDLVCTASGGGTYDCVYGTCNNATDTCDCFVGFYGADCGSVCPTNQDLAAITQRSGIVEATELDVSQICSGHGVCDEGSGGSGGCTCNANYATADCSVACPRDPETGLVCSNNGTCAAGAGGDGTCTCNAPRYGDDCSKRPCGVRRCLNGDCIDNARCACKYDANNGYWAGLECDKCAPGYTGSDCKSRVVNVRTITGDALLIVQNNAANIYSYERPTSPFDTILLPRVESVAKITFTHAAGIAEVSVNDRWFRTDRANPTRVFEVPVWGGENFGGWASEQLLDIKFASNIYSVQQLPPDVATMDLSFTLVVEYIPGCGLSNDCGQGFCVPTAAAIAEAETELDDFWYFSKSAHALSKSRVTGEDAGAAKKKAGPPERHRTKAAVSARQKKTSAERTLENRRRRAEKIAERKAHRAAASLQAREKRSEKLKALSRTESPRPLGGTAKAHATHEQPPTHAHGKHHSKEANQHHKERLVMQKETEFLFGKSRQDAVRAERKMEKVKTGTLHKHGEHVPGQHTAPRRHHVDHMSSAKATVLSRGKGSSRQLLQGPPPGPPGPLPALTLDWVSVDGTTVDLDLLFDEDGYAQMGVIPTGVTPDDMGVAGIVGGGATNFDHVGDMFSFAWDDLWTETIEDLSMCQSYDFYYESVDWTYQVASGPVLLLSDEQIVPSSVPAVSTSRIAAHSTSFVLTLELEGAAKVYACMSAVGAVVPDFTACSGGASATATAANGYVVHIRLGGLTADTEYDVNWETWDECDSGPDVSDYATERTAVSGLPALTNVATANVVGSGFDFTFDSDVGGTLHYVLQVVSAAPVSVSQIKTVIPSINSGVVQRSNAAISPGANTVTISGLDPATKYVLRSIVSNAADDEDSGMNVPTTVITPGPAPPYPEMRLIGIAPNPGVQEVDFTILASGAPGECAILSVQGEPDFTSVTPTDVYDGNFVGRQDWFTIGFTGVEEVGEWVGYMPMPCQPVSLFYICRNGADYSPVVRAGKLSDPMDNLPGVSITQVVAGSSTIRAILDVTNGPAEIEVCAAPATGSPIDATACTGGTRRQLTAGTGTLYVTIPELPSSTNFDLNYRAGTQCPTPVYTPTQFNAVSTNAAGAPELTGLKLQPGTGNVTLTFTSDLPGRVVLAVQDMAGTPEFSKSGIDGLSVGGTVAVKESFSIVGGENTFTTPSSLSTGTTYMVNYYSEDASSTTFSPYFFTVFSTGGVLPYTSLWANDPRGTWVGVEVDTDMQALVHFQIRLADEAEPTIEDIRTLSGSYVVAQKFVTEVHGSGSTVYNYVIAGLEPMTEYVLYYWVMDTAETVGEPRWWTTWFTTTNEGVSRCQQLAGSQPCTKASGPNAQGVCECFPGYSCSPDGACRSAEELYAGLEGKCECLQTPTDGYWNGTVCSKCLGSYFGSSCQLTCLNGGEFTGTGCTCTGRFSGTDCSVCSSAGGFYGANCDTAADVATMKNSYSLQDGKTVTYPTFKVMTYSEVFVNLTMEEGDTVSALSAVEIVLLKEFAPASLAGEMFFDSNGDLVVPTDFGSTGPEFGEEVNEQVAAASCGEVTVADLSLPSTNNNLVHSCHLQDTWSGTKRVQTCRLDVPSGYNYALVRLVGARTADVDVTIRAVGGCCNGNGFCGKDTTQCSCAAHSELGFYNPADQCDSCAPGYTGARCTEFAGDARQITSGDVTSGLGDEHWWSFRVQPNQKFVAELTADVDCDLSVTTTSRCGDGWSFYEGRCYKVFADYGECTTPNNAEAFCKRQGADVATVRAETDLDFFKQMFSDMGLSDPNQASAFCDTRVIVDGKRRNIKGCQPQNTQAKCEAVAGCQWDFGPEECVVAEAQDCYDFANGNEDDCIGTFDPQRRPCQWVTYDYPTTPDVYYPCQPMYEFRDTAMTTAESIDLLMDSARSDMGTVSCFETNFEADCMLIPYCFWNSMSSMCQMNFAAIHSQGAPVWYDRPENGQFQESDSNFYKEGMPRCAYITSRQYSGNVHMFFGEMECNIPAEAKPDSISSSAITYGSAAVMCERAFNPEESAVSASNVASKTNPQAALMGVPECQRDSGAADHVCELFSGTGENLALVRVVCQAEATFDISVSMVREGRVDGLGNSQVCFNDVTSGSWAGELCTECAPRYSGHECKTFTGCASDADCGQGTCNVGTGLCSCNANYFGVACDTYCDSAATCNGGTCNANYQVCAGALGTSRACNVEQPLCVTCPGSRTGATCQTCDFGSWDLTTDCGSACDCDGQPCDATTGACQCYDDDLRGFWNVSTKCEECVTDFYGVSCTVECFAGETCDDHGTCDEKGQCECEEGHFGPNCASFCTVAHCNYHGSCTAQGACSCDSGFATGFWTGATCDTCVTGYWGAKCDQECQCNARGKCDKFTGVCDCFDDDANGHFTGDTCAACAAGYAGADCKTSTAGSKNQMGIKAKVPVKTTARLTKSRVGGTLLMFNLSGTEHMWVTTGKQLSEFTRAQGSIDADAWQHTQSCTMSSETDDNVIAGELHEERGYALYLVNGSGAVLNAIRFESTDWVNSDGSCKTAVTTTLYTREMYGANNTGGLAESVTTVAKGMVLDAATNSLYVMTHVVNRTNDIDRVYLSKVFIWEDADVRKGFLHPRQNQFRRLSELSEGHGLTLMEEDGVKAVIVSGLDTKGRIMFTKIYLTTAEQPTLRAVYSWNPPVCRSYTCVETSLVAFRGGRLYAAIRTTTTLGVSRMLIVQMAIVGSGLKQPESNWNAVMAPLQGALNCSFIEHDSYVDAFYVGLHANGADAGVVYKYDGAFARTYSVTLQLGYEQTVSERQVPVAARVNAERRELLIVNQLTRSHVLTASLYEVESIVPNVVDGNGGTLVNVTGNGFKQLPGNDIFCRFGTRTNRQLTATYVDSTRIVCQAPMATSFDPCEAVPLEIAFDGMDSFTNNQVLVTQANIPQVSDVLPATRGGLTLSEPLTIVGSGFINTDYITCFAAGKKYPATFVSATTVLCQPDSQAAPRNTTLQVSLDGQSFTNNQVYYYFVGDPSFFAAFLGEPRTVGGVTYGAMTDRGWQVDSAAYIPVPEMLVVFFDAAHTALESRDQPLRQHTVSVELQSRPTAPLDDVQYGRLRGTLNQTIQRGGALFTDLYIEYPGAGTYVLNFYTSYPGLPNQTITFTVEAKATRLLFQQVPPDFSTNKEALATTTVVRFSDVSDNTATTEAAKVNVRVEKINGTDASTSAALTGNDVETDQGLAVFDALRIENGEEEAFYQLVFSAVTSQGVTLELESAPIRVATCDATVNWISRIVPSEGTLGSAVVTIKGWGYTRALEPLTKCRFGAEAAVQAVFVDKCTVLCPLPAKTAPYSAPLEVATTTTSEFSSYGFNYSYISSVDSLALDNDARTTYASAAVVALDAITLRFRDAFPTWVRGFDSVERTVHMQTSVPLLNASGEVPSALATTGNAVVRFDGLRVGFPLVGRYGLFFSTDSNAAMPVIDGAANVSTPLETAAPTGTVVVVNQTAANGSSCPVPLQCHKVGRRFLECLYPVAEEDVSVTATVTEEVIVPSVTANATLAPETTSLATPVPPVTTAAAVPTASPNVHFSALYLFDVTEGVPAALHFVGTYDMFTTGKRKLDRQPVLRVADVAGNTVTGFVAAPTVTATISPEPPCLTDAAAGVTQAQHELTCDRLLGSSVQVVNGLATFQNVRFRGRAGEQYRLSFGVSLANVPALEGGAMYTADCPAGNALLDRVEPNWITLSVGGVITAKGWDFQPDTALTLQLGTTSISCNYVDTCTALCPVAAASGRRQSSSSTGAVDITLSSGTSSSSAQSSAFQLKAAVATHVGYARTIRGYYRAGTYSNHSQTLPVTENVTCTLLEGDTSADARDCYTANTMVNLLPVFVALQDAGNGDIFAGHGWDSSLNHDVGVQLRLTSKPATDRRSESEIFRGSLTSRTVDGSVTLGNLQIVAPRTGDYVLTVTATDASMSGSTLVSRTYTIRITPGQAHVLTITHSLRRNRDDNAYVVENNVGLGISGSITDVNGNPLGISAFSSEGRWRVSMLATITPEVVLQPPPYGHLPVDALNADYNTSVFSGSPADLGVEVFDFTAATVNNIKFGVRYNLTFTIDDASLAALLPSQSMLVTLGSCQSGQYSQNVSSTCSAIPEGGETRVGNHTLWLYAQPGYWRPEFYFAKFYECPGSNCLGGYYSDCKTGTTGVVCAVCEDGYGKQGTDCLECPSDAINIVVLIAIAIAVLIVIIILVQSNLSAEVKPKSVFSIVIKILLNHLQTATLTRDFQEKVTGIVKDLFDIQDQATPDTNFMSFNCLTGWNMYAIFLMWMLVPLFVLGLPGIIAVVAYFVQRRSLAQKKDRLIKELERRRVMGLQTVDVEMHLEALKTRELPEKIFDLDDEPSEVSHDPADDAEMDNAEMDEVFDREMKKHEEREKREEEHQERVSRRAKELFGSESDAMDMAAVSSSDDSSPRRRSLTVVVNPPAGSDSPAASTKADKAGDAAAAQKEDQPTPAHTPRSQPFSRTTSPQPALSQQPSVGAVSRSPGLRRQKRVTLDENGKPLQAGLDNCMICCADFATYRCEECPDEPLFCETCWRVVHAPEGDRADHDRLLYLVENADKREYNKKYQKLYEEVMATKNKVPATEIYIVTVLVVVFLIYPSLMTQIAMMMKCTEIDSIGRSFLAADYSIECDTPEYNRWVRVAQAFFFAYGVGIPLAGTVLLFVKRKRLLEKSTMATYGFLYSGYRLKHFFWEFVIMVRKMLVVFIIVFYAGEREMAIMLGMWLVLGFLILNIMVQPFQLRLYWRLENVSLLSVTVTLNAAMLYQERFGIAGTANEIWVTVFIFIVNIVVLAMFLYYIVFAAKLQMLKAFDLDGSGDVSWYEFKLVFSLWLHQNHGKSLREWGFQVDDPTEEIEEIRNQRKLKIQMAAANDWKRGQRLHARQKLQKHPHHTEYSTGVSKRGSIFSLAPSKVASANPSDSDGAESAAGESVCSPGDTPRPQTAEPDVAADIVAATDEGQPANEPRGMLVVSPTTGPEKGVASFSD